VLAKIGAKKVLLNLFKLFLVCHRPIITRDMVSIGLGEINVQSVPFLFLSWPFNPLLSWLFNPFISLQSAAAAAAAFTADVTDYCNVESWDKSFMDSLFISFYYQQ
jgi:hypothetical protein